MRMKSKIYWLIISVFQIIPPYLRIFLFRCWKISGIHYGKLYKDLRYIGKLKIKVNNSYFLIDAKGGTIDNEIFWNGLDKSLESEIIWIWKLLFTKNIQTVFDIGANIGIYSLLSKTLNEKAKIYSFEASRNTFKILKENVNLNSFDIYLEEIAISNTTESKEFYDMFDPNQTNASLSYEMSLSIKERSLAINKYLVQTTTIDEYIKNSSIVSIDLIKIDVELHEPEVFEGMHNTLKIFEPFILFEVLTNDVSTKINSFLSKINNYLLFEFIYVNNQFYIKEINCVEGRPQGNWNFFLCPKSKFHLISQYQLK